MFQMMGGHSWLVSCYISTILLENGRGHEVSSKFIYQIISSPFVCIKATVKVYRDEFVLKGVA